MEAKTVALKDCFYADNNVPQQLFSPSQPAFLCRSRIHVKLCLNPNHLSFSPCKKRQLHHHNQPEKAHQKRRYVNQSLPTSLYNSINFCSSFSQQKTAAALLHSCNHFS